MAGRAADVVDVAGPDALLDRDGALLRVIDLRAAHEMIFELIHAGAREKHAGIVLRHEQIGRNRFVAARTEERDPATADFIGREKLRHGGLNPFSRLQFEP